MKYLFTPAGISELKRLSRQKRPLFAFDFDGTLAPIVTEPGAAGAAARTDELLGEIKKRERVAVLSGRRLRDLRARVRATRAHYMIGNHGLEGSSADPAQQTAARRSCRKWLQQLRGEPLSEVGINLEDKTLTLTLHYRGAPNLQRARRTILKLLPKLAPKPRVIFGKDAINLIPDLGVEKGTALRRLARDCRASGVLFIGDDITDEDAFRAKIGHLVSIRVGKKRDSAARFYIRSQSEINRVLQILVDLLR